MVMRIRVSHPFKYLGVERAVGTVLEVDDDFGKRAIGEGYARLDAAAPPTPTYIDPELRVALSGVVADNISTPGTASEVAVTSKVSTSAWAGALRGVDLWTFGHSFLTVLPDLAAQAEHYPYRLAAMTGMRYPTAADGTNLSRAVGGSRVEEAAEGIVGSSPFPAGRRGVVIIQALLNTLGYRNLSTTPQALRAARHALRAMVVTASASARYESTHSIFTRTGTWTTGNATSASGGSFHSTSEQNAYTEVTLPARPVGTTGVHHIITTAKSTAAGSGPIIRVKNMTTDVTIARLDLSDQSVAGDTPGSIQMAIPLNAADGNVIRITKEDAGTGSLLIDCLLAPAKDPVPVIGVKEPYLVDYAASTAFPFRSDAQVNAFNALWDEMAAQYANVFPVDPNTTYWNKATDISWDKVHPNALGHLHLSQAALEGVRAAFVQRAFGGLRTPPVVGYDALAAPPTVYASDNFDRATTAVGGVGPSPVGNITPADNVPHYRIAASTGCYAYVDTNVAADLLWNTLQANGTLTAKRRIFGAGHTGGLAFRMAADRATGFVFYEVGGVYVLGKRTALGTTAALVTSTTVPAADDDVKVILNGNSIKCYVNGVLAASVTDAMNATATLHGFWTPPANDSHFDDWRHDAGLET